MSAGVTHVRQRRSWRTAFLDFPIGILAAVQFLTILPTIVRRPFIPEELGRSVGWFPLVGLALGGVLAGADLGLGFLLPPGVTAALLLIVWVLATGVLHLDGFLDTCDGLFGGRTPESQLRIMRDERVGAYAVTGGVLLLILKYTTLAALVDRTACLVVAPVIGRWGMSVAVVTVPYARAEGLGRDMKDHARWPQAALATIVALAVAVLVGGRWGGLAAIMAMPATVAVVAFVLRRLPGLTGDVYGALCEILEVLTLLVFVAGEWSCR